MDYLTSSLVFTSRTCVLRTIIERDGYLTYFMLHNSLSKNNNKLLPARNERNLGLYILI